MTGEGWPIVKKPYFSTIIHNTVGGQQIRIPNYPYPLTEFDIPINVLSLTTGDFQAFWGFYVARSGPWDSFLLYDPTDYSTLINAANEGLVPSTAQNVIATGDGFTRSFQLMRSFFGAQQPVFDINGITQTYGSPAAPVLYTGVGAGASVQSASVSSVGMVTLSSAPGFGVPITADFSYFWRVTFGEDFLSFENFVSNLFSVKSIKLKQVYA